MQPWNVFVIDFSTLMIVCLESLLGYRDWSGHSRGSNEAKRNVSLLGVCIPLICGAQSSSGRSSLVVCRVQTC